jgi:hypothetical protein
MANLEEGLSAGSMRVSQLMERFFGVKSARRSAFVCLCICAGFANNKFQIAGARQGVMRQSFAK